MRPIENYTMSNKRCLGNEVRYRKVRAFDMACWSIHNSIPWYSPYGNGDTPDARLFGT